MEHLHMLFYAWSKINSYWESVSQYNSSDWSVIVCIIYYNTRILVFWLTITLQTALSLFIALKNFSFDKKLSTPAVYEHKKLWFQDWLRNKCACLSKVKLLTVERRLCGPLLLPQIPGPTVRVESAATWLATCLRGHVCNWPSWIIVRTAGRAPWRIPLLIPRTSKRRTCVLVQMFHLRNQLTGCIQFRYLMSTLEAAQKMLAWYEICIS
jgi:hypothetical protein